MSTPVVFCVVPVHNRAEVTAQFLRCAMQQTYPKVEIIVVDDGSTDGTSELLAGLNCPNLTVLKGNGSLWWAGAMRLAMEHVLTIAAAGDYLLMINDDVHIKPDYVELLVAESSRTPHTIVGSLQCDGTTEIPMVSGYKIDYWQVRIIPLDPRSVLADALPGRGTLFPLAAVRACGLVRTRVLAHYLADLEYTARAKESGWKLVICHEARVYTSSIGSDLAVRRKGLAHRYFSNRSKENLIMRLLFFTMRGPLISRLTALPRFGIMGALRILGK
jgi:N-acetylglucosaminyl-diphospho-decaprenol L-rhamnosyltransferase